MRKTVSATSAHTHSPEKRPPKEQRDRDRIERLTAAAFDLFTELGYHNTPIEMLCSRANVSTRDFYKLCKTLEVLMTRVYQQVATRVEASVLDALAKAPPGDAAARMDAAISAWVHAYTDDPRYARLAYLEAIGISDELELVRRTAHEHFAKIIRKEFQNRFPDNRNVLDGKLPVAIIGACNELVRDWLSREPRQKPIKLEQEIQRVYNVIIRGLDT